MTIEEYQALCTKTAVYPELISLLYVTLGLAGESGEVANKVKKVYRDDGGKLTTAAIAGISDELGDCLWYIAMLCTEMGVSLEWVMRGNIAKLEKRMAESSIKGNGDQR